MVVYMQWCCRLGRQVGRDGGGLFHVEQRGGWTAANSGFAAAAADSAPHLAGTGHLRSGLRGR